MPRRAPRAVGRRPPADFYAVGVPVPAGWPEDGASHVRLSPACNGAAAEARSRGWPVTGDAGGAQLGIATSPARVAGLVT